MSTSTDLALRELWGSGQSLEAQCGNEYCVIQRLELPMPLGFLFGLGNPSVPPWSSCWEGPAPFLAAKTWAKYNGWVWLRLVAHAVNLAGKGRCQAFLIWAVQKKKIFFKFGHNEPKAYWYWLIFPNPYMVFRFGIFFSEIPLLFFFCSIIPYGDHYSQYGI